MPPSPPPVDGPTPLSLSVSSQSTLPLPLPLFSRSVSPGCSLPLLRRYVAAPPAARPPKNPSPGPGPVPCGCGTEPGGYEGEVSDGGCLVYGGGGPLPPPPKPGPPPPPPPPGPPPPPPWPCPTPVSRRLNQLYRFRKMLKATHAVVQIAMICATDEIILSDCERPGYSDSSDGSSVVNSYVNPHDPGTSSVNNAFLAFDQA